MQMPLPVNLNQNAQYIAWGILTSLLVLHWLWCQFVAYPISFEKNLKRGKPWVYIPLRWKGARKIQIRFFSRVIMLSVIAVGILLASVYTHRMGWSWYLLYALIVGFMVMRLNTLWLEQRYRQQEDSYYFLHDELRSKLESEGKDIADSAFKSLAAYQYQNLLRKADEQGTLIKTLRAQAKESRKKRKQVQTQEPVEV